MAAQPRIDIITSSSIADGSDGDALAFSVLHDLLGVASFLASHPLNAAYALFFSRYLLRLASFFCPLLVSTALLLLVVATVAPYATPGWAGARSMGRTCAIAVAALCAELRPDAGGGAGLVGQLCSFVLGPGDVAAVLRFGEITGELCHSTSGSCCFLVEENHKGLVLLSPGEERNNLAAEPPLQSAVGEKYVLGHGDFNEIKDEIEEKNVVSEDLKKGPGSCSLEDRCPSEAFVQVMEERDNSIKEQSLILPAVDGVGDGVEEKKLEGDPVVPMVIKKCELVKSHSSISRRIRQWEAATSGNFRGVDDTLGNPVKPTLEKGSFKGVKGSTQLETGSCIKKRQEISPVEESDIKQPDQEFIHVKKWDPKTETDTGKCSKDVQAEESASIAEPGVGLQLQGQKHKDSQDGPELQEQEYRPEQEFQEENKKDAQPEQGSQEEKHKPASIARRAHSGASSTENPVSEEGSPRKEKEWKKTLACKLYEERIQLKLCRGRAAAVGGGECSDDMDMLWEAYETGGGGNKQKEEIVEPEDGGESEEEDGPDEGPVRQLCCLQALKFSTRKMNFGGGGGNPSLAKISKVLKRMTALSRVGSRRK